MHIAVEMLALFIGEVCDLHNGFFCFLIHKLTSPFAVQQLAQLHIIEVCDLNEQCQIGHVASGFPTGHSSARDIEFFRKLFLCDSFLLAECFQKVSDLLLIHSRSSFRNHDSTAAPGNTGHEVSKMRVFTLRDMLCHMRHRLYLSIFCAKSQRSGI